MDSDISMKTFDRSSMLVVEPRQPEETYNLGQIRRDILAELDSARFSWFQVKVCIVAGIGFFTDAYDNFAISIASVMIGLVYPGKDCWAGPWGFKQGRNDELLLKLGTPVGNIVGQLVFGWLADVLGRKRMYGFELIIIIVSTFGQSVAGNSYGINIYALLFVWRFFMGLGIGGDYPLSAIIASEFAATRYRGKMMTAVFAAQGWGNLTAALVAVIIVSAFKSQITVQEAYACPSSDSLNPIDHMWRLLIGFGCIPAAIALYFRLTIPETPRFSLDVEGDLPQAFHDVHAEVVSVNTHPDEEEPTTNISVPGATWTDFREYFGRWENLKVLIAAAYCWFVLDIAFYGLSLNTATIIGYLGFGDPANDNVYNRLHNISVGNLVVIISGLIPGYWATFLFIDSWGRKPIQYMGFAVLSCLSIIVGFAFDALTKDPKSQKGLVFLYCLANFFFNFGPNVTTFLIPGEVFPTRYRATCHGIAAASGKLGAVIAQLIFHMNAPPAEISKSWPNATASQESPLDTTPYAIKTSFKVFGFMLLTGIAATYLLPEPKGESLEKLSNEDQKTFVRGPSRNSARRYRR